MQLTARTLPVHSSLPHALSRWSRPSIASTVIAAMVAIFALDRRFEAAPLQHLYYVPIIVSAVWLGSSASLGVALMAVVLKGEEV